MPIVWSVVLVCSLILVQCWWTKNYMGKWTFDVMVGVITGLDLSLVVVDLHKSVDHYVGFSERHSTRSHLWSTLRG